MIIQINLRITRSPGCCTCFCWVYISRPSAIYSFYSIMEVEYSGGGVLIFSYLILTHQLDHFGGLCDNFGSKFIGCRFDGVQTVLARSQVDRSWIAARLYLTNSAKRKKRKPPRSATDGALGRTQTNSTSMILFYK